MGLSGLLGLAVGGGTASFLTWEAATLLGWDAAAACFVAWTWTTVVRLESEDTKTHAGMINPGRRLSEGIILATGIALLAAVGLLLVRASQSQGGTKAYFIAIGTASVVLCWGTVHTVFTLRYARTYYEEEVPEPSIDFNEDSPPDYRDFAYLALTVGMTFQVSDTNLKTKPMRRLVMSHALLSYLYGAVILALAINVVASLLSSH